MPPGRGLSAAAVLGIALAASVPARAQPPVPASPPPSPSPAASVPVLPPRPVSESVDRVVQRMEEAREDPCKQARDEGRPCFPVITTQKGEEFSVRKSLGLPDQDKTKPTPGGAPLQSFGSQGCSQGVAGQFSAAARRGKALAPSMASRMMSAWPA